MSEYTLNVGEKSEEMLNQMMEHYDCDINELVEMSIHDMHAAMLVVMNNGHLIITPEGGAPRPIPFNEFFRQPPLRVVK